MHALGRGLSLLGRHGPGLLVASLVLGALAAPLAAAAYEMLTLSAFLLTLGSFLTANLAPDEQRLGWRRGMLILMWVGIAIPSISAAIMSRLHLDQALEAGVLLSVLAPPVGSAAAIAAILGLRPRLALIASVALTLAVPLTMPAFASLFGLSVSLNLMHLALRLAVIIGLAAVLAQLARYFRTTVAPLLPDSQAAAGVAVAGLMIVGLATMRGVRVHWAEDPSSFTVFALSAVGVNLGAGLLGTVLFSSWGAVDALTVGLVSGNRNVTLAWAAAGAALPPATEAYVAACVLPVLALPLAVKAVFGARSWLRRAEIGTARPTNVAVGTTPEA